jgi:serralysin
VNSGTTQNLLTVFSAAGGFTGGLTVAAGDFDGDGRDDIVVGTASRVGVAAVFSGLVPTPVAVFGELAGFGGVNVAAGDIDGDGRADVVLGTASGVPVVTAHDGATQRMRGAFVANYGLGSGVRVATADHNGDGIADVVTGFGGPVPLVSVYSGLSLSPLDAFLAQTPGMADSPQGVYVG